MICSAGQTEWSAWVRPGLGSLEWLLAVAASSRQPHPPPAAVLLLHCSNTQQTYLSQYHWVSLSQEHDKHTQIKTAESYFYLQNRIAHKFTHIYWRGWAANLKPNPNNPVNLAGVWTVRSQLRTWTVSERPSHYLMLIGQKKLPQKNLERYNLCEISASPRSLCLLFRCWENMASDHLRGNCNPWFSALIKPVMSHQVSWYLPLRYNKSG